MFHTTRLNKLKATFVHSVLLVIFATGCGSITHAADEKVDVCVYGGTASGVCAGLAAARRGNSVVIVDPFRHLGGMHGGGIRLKQDCMYRKDIGGIAKELHDEDGAMPGSGSTNQWQARLMMMKKVKEAGIKAFTEHRLDSADDVVKNGTNIEMIHLNYAPIMDEGVPPPKPQKRHVLSVKAKVFIDASYEGDLMAFSGADYTVGRESMNTYDESLGGQRGLKYFDVDPYVVPGDPSSGVLPMITTEPYEPGAASKYMIAYNFRLQWVEEGGTVLKSLGREVDREKYELVIRGLKSAPKSISWPHKNYARKAMVSSGVPARQADILIGQGKTVPEVCKQIEISEHTYYRWRQKYGGMSPEMVKELRALQKENARLRKVVADQAVENAILKEVASKN